MRAAADNREMAEALGVDMRSVYVRVFTLGCMLGTLGGALVIPVDGGHERDGHRAHRGGVRGRGDRRARQHAGRARRARSWWALLRAVAIAVYPELEMLLIYLIVIAVLVLRPRGLFGKAAVA